MTDCKLLILDFGSQYTQLIARVVRELGVYCEILPGNIEYQRIAERKPQALILSGGPASVFDEDSPQLSAGVLELGVPVLGICYGMQLIAQEFNGVVEPWDSGNDKEDEATREFGPASVKIVENKGPFSSIAPREELSVWMSHGDKVTKLPEGFSLIASSQGAAISAFANQEKKIFGLQFHPEVHHTPRGKELIENFVFKIADLKKDWDGASFVSATVAEISQKAPSGNVVCGLSGGVDSTVAAYLVHKAIGKRLFCIFVDNGLLREGEAEEVMETMQTLGLQIKKVDASKRFLQELAGVRDPEKKAQDNWQSLYRSI